MNKILLLILIVLTFQVSGNSQDNDLSKYAIGLFELVTFADNPGFKDEVTIDDLYKEIEWFKDEDGYNYTKDIEYCDVFAYKVIHNNENDYIVGVYSDSEGTAQLSYLLRILTTENTIKLQDVIGGGDRCRNAVRLDEISLENDIISFSTLITPNNIMKSSGNKNFNSRYDDCMVCCCGFSNYTYDVKTSTTAFNSILIIGEYLTGNIGFRKAYEDSVKNKPINISLTLNERELTEFIKSVTSYNNE